MIADDEAGRGGIPAGQGVGENILGVLDRVRGQVGIIQGVDVELDLCTG